MPAVLGSGRQAVPEFAAIGQEGSGAGSRARRAAARSGRWPAGFGDVQHGAQDPGGPVDQVAGEAAVDQDEPYGWGVTYAPTAWLALASAA